MTYKFMEKILIFLFIIISLNINCVRNVYAQSQYVNTDNHYSFTVPNGWSEIPKNIIEEYVAKVVKQTNGKSVEYETGFQQNQDNYFDYPYILVQSHLSSNPSYSQIEKSLNDSDFKNSFAVKSTEYSELINSASMEKPFIDKERNLIFINIQIDNVSVGKINGLIVMFLGSERITQLNFYAKADDYNEWLPIFNSVVDSFLYENGYKYTSKSVSDGAAEKGTVGLFTGALAGIFILVVGIFTTRKKVKDVK